MGARASPDKSVHLSNSQVVRDSLRRQVIPEFGAKVPTTVDMRDLGSHMNLGRRYVASTVAARMQAAICDTRVLRSLPSPIANKVA
eukprot:5654016-Alexandrium_andersonii.AAC.1